MTLDWKKMIEKKLSRKNYRKKITGKNSQFEKVDQNFNFLIERLIWLFGKKMKEKCNNLRTNLK